MSPIMSNQYTHTQFSTRLKQAFLRNKNLTNPAQIVKCIAHGDYVQKEMEALWMVRKYRAMKRRYYD